MAIYLFVCALCTVQYNIRQVERGKQKIKSARTNANKNVNIQHQVDLSQSYCMMRLYFLFHNQETFTTN